MAWAMSSVISPAMSTLLGATVDASYRLADEIKITRVLGDAARFPAHHVKHARELAAKLNAAEGHHRWRAERWDRAQEIEKAA